MADTFIQLPADSTGKKVRSFSFDTGSDIVHSQANTIVDANGNVMSDLSSGRLLVDGSGVTQPVSDGGGSLTVDGSVTANPTRPATSSVTSPTTSTTNAQLLAANTNRLGATIYNDSTQNMFLKLGTTASSTSFTIRMAPQSHYEVPFGYTGRIDGILSSGTGNARVTELTT